MKRFHFNIIASGLDPEAEDFADRFFEAGCSDATLSFQKGAIILEFDREARNLAHALLSAVMDVLRAGAKVEHIEPQAWHGWAGRGEARPGAAGLGKAGHGLTK